jgi:molecular chaperone DnaK (HSP70)
VSVVRVHADRDEQQLRLANLSIARYERLGGDNIDAAIVERVLLPQLLRQNGLETLDVSFSEKQERIVPQLLSVAEALKLGGRDVPRSLQVELPARVGLPLRTLALRHPSMTAAAFDEVLAPFLDADCTYPRDTEMNRVSSIFVPVRDALRRARLEPGQVDAVLLAGGSALLPQVQDALSGFFPRAELLRFPDDARTLCGVARGAALHSFFLHGIGRPLLRPITSESLGILTQEGGYVELVPRGAELPFPADGKAARSSSLVVPRDLMRSVQIVVAAEGPDRVLGVEHLTVPVVRSAGEPIDVTVRLDGNKLLTVEATLPNHPGARCEVLLENPLCPPDRGSPRQRQIAELEDLVARAQARGGNPAGIADNLERLAALYVEENKFERAIDRAREAMEVDRKPSDVALCTMAFAADRLGAVDRAEKYYREAIAVDPGDPTHPFNLSLLLNRQDRGREALDLAEEAFRLCPAEAVYRGWRAILFRRFGRHGEALVELQRAAADLDALVSRDAWREHWRGRIAQELGDRAWKARPSAPDSEASGPSYDTSLLPGQRGELARRAS